MLKEFGNFIKKGNVIDLAVAVIIGGAFGAIVKSLVNDVIMPPIGLLLGGVDFANLFIDLSGEGYATLAAAQEAGAATLNYGVFINAVINFLIVAFVIFWLFARSTKWKRKKRPRQPPRRQRNVLIAIQKLP